MSLKTYQYWRFNLSINSGQSNYVSLSEIRFYGSTYAYIPSTGQTYIVSSSYDSTNHNVSNCFDNDNTTWWANNNSTDPTSPSIEIEFSSAQSISCIKFYSRLGSSAQAPASIVVQGSTDGSTWTTLGTITPTSWSDNVDNVIVFQSNPNALAYVSQETLSALVVGTPNAVISQENLSALVIGTPNAIMSQLSLQVLWWGQIPPPRGGTFSMIG